MKHILISLSFLFNSTLIFADSDTTIAAQRTACASKSGYEWDSNKNRCVMTSSTYNLKTSVDSCKDITDVESKKKCYMSNAESQSGVKSDPSKADISGGKLAISSAYGLLGALLMVGGINGSDCPSKTIFGVTAIAGAATDWLIKMMASKKAKELTDKYKIDTKTNSYYSQSRALEYLKEEQETIKSLAQKEKLRNLALTAGFAAAGVMAAVEVSPYGQATFPNCYKPDGGSAAGSQTPAGPPAVTP